MKKFCCLCLEPDTTMQVHVGVDVGGTNTDAVVLQDNKVIGTTKQFTTQDVTTGVSRAVTAALEDARAQTKQEVLSVSRVHIGTTHFVNAVVQKRHLVRVAVIRLCGPASQSLPPFSDFPDDLNKVVNGGVYMLNGGYDFDGSSEIRPVDPSEVLETIKDVQQHGINNVVISGVFSVVNSTQEFQVKSLFKEHYPSCSITLSHQVGQMGILERENAAILNESLKPLCQTTVTAFRASLDQLSLTCPFFLTQNDGTLISDEHTLEQPVLTFASGPTNSMRGAAFLSGVSDAVVADIGGTSTDVGMLIAGFPREASTKVKVGEVPTNFRMPDVVCIGLGGGSIVSHVEQESDIKVQVGPQSVGFRLVTEGLVFGGSTLTSSDIAVKAGLVAMGDAQKVAPLSSNLVEKTVEKMRDMVEQVIDKVKISKEAVPVILVGGGSVLIDSSQPLNGTTKVIKPKHFAVANAVGAALSQVSGTVDYTVSLEEKTREVAINEAKVKATDAAIQAGADPDNIKITDVMEVPLAYLPGNATRVKVRAVGDLRPDPKDAGVEWSGPPSQQEEITQNREDGVKQTHTATGQNLDGEGVAVTESEPLIDPDSGEWTLSEWDIECIAIGAGILGTGGGGSPNIGRLRARKLIRQGKKIRVVTPERLNLGEHDRVCFVAMMGAPTILIERVPNGRESVLAVECIQNLHSCDQITDGSPFSDEGIEVKTGDGIKYVDDYKPKNSKEDHKEGLQIKALMSGEIGGSNAMEPLCTGAMMDLPVADCDFMGRAFPELQMTTNLIYGIPPYPAALADHNGRQAAIIHADSAKHLENHFRQVCMDMGCAASFVERPLTKQEVLDTSILYSVSRAWRLGHAVLHAREHKQSPIDTILQHEGGILLCTGKISDVERRTTGGFARGDLKMEGFGTFQGQQLHVQFQNENLVASSLDADGKQKVLACTPDLISLVDVDTGEPIATEEVRYGLRVAVLAMSAAPRLCTPAALAVVGPQAFGYSEEEVTFKPCGEYVEHDPVPPR